MTTVADAIDRARARVADVAHRIFADLCTVSVPGGATNAGDGTWGDGSPTETPDVPMKYEPLSAYERQTAGRVGGFADYKLTFPFVWEGAALLVPADSTVTVNARDPNPERTFTVTGPLYSSSGLWLEVSAKLEG